MLIRDLDFCTLCYNFLELGVLKCNFDIACHFEVIAHFQSQHCDLSRFDYARSLHGSAMGLASYFENVISIP